MRVVSDSKVLVFPEQRRVRGSHLLPEFDVSVERNLPGVYGRVQKTRDPQSTR